MLADPELLSDFFSALSPKDDKPKVAKAIVDIWNSDAESFKKFPRLALAIAVVFDTPPPKTWPHAQVSEKYLPRKFPEPAAAFAEWKAARDKGRLLFRFETMSAESAPTRRTSRRRRPRRAEFRRSYSRARAPTASMRGPRR